MTEKVSKQVETSPTLERRRVKYTVEDVRQLVVASAALQSCVRFGGNGWPVIAHVEPCASLKNTSRATWKGLNRE